MLSEEKILDEAREIKEWAKRLTKKAGKSNPYFNDEHEAITLHAKELSYHAVYGVFPAELIEKAAPNETQEEFLYRKANYKQVTKPAWDKAETFVYRIWNVQNYQIEWKDEDYENYFTYEFPRYGNYISFFRDVISKHKFRDPNAVVLCKPYDIPMIAEESDGEIIMRPDQTAQLKPYVEIYRADQVFEFEEGVYCLLKSDKKSVVRTDKGLQEVGYIFELVDSENIYLIKQVGNEKDYDFEIEVYYQHSWGYPPAFKLRGVPVYDQDMYYYHSYFSGALPNLDMAVVMSSTMFGSIQKTAYPTRWYYEDSCSNCNGEGWVLNEDSDKIGCRACNSTGKSQTFSFGKDFVIKMPENTSDASRFEAANLPTPPFGVVNPGTETIEFLDKKVQSLIEDAFANLNIDIASQPNGQTATESKIDREEAFSFLVQVSSELFGLLQATLDAMVWMRYMTDEVRPVVIAPNEFTIRSSAALTEEFSKAMEAKLPSTYLTSILKESVKQRFKGDAVQERITEIVSTVDPIMTKSELEINSMVGSGAILKWQSVLHANIYQYIFEEQSTNENFIYGDIWSEVFPVLKAKAEAAAVTSQVRTADEILNDLTR